MSAIPRYRATTAPAVLSAGFRPFFLLAGLWAAFAVPFWLLLLAAGRVLPVAMAPLLWHAHEMIFGFALATVAGFLFTAVPNWTGRMPLQGASLGVLVLLWIVGRVAMLVGGGLPVAVPAVLDLAFPAALTAAIGREIVTGRNWRNLPVLAALGVLLVADLLMQVGAAARFGLAMAGARLGIATLTALVTLIGGRIIPSFTRNWLLRREPQGALPAPFGLVDRAALAMSLAGLALWVVRPGSAVVAVLLLAAGVAHALRLARWRGLATLGEPLLAVLHLGYAWLAFGLALLGVDRFVTLMPASVALHALTVGAIGTMTLAVMARASLGHTGQALTSSTRLTVVFVLVSVAAMLRLLAAIVPGSYVLMLDFSGAAWAGAFALFVVQFAPLLTRPRRRGAG
ncbi:MAG: NnrS family protein [Rhodospirillales bacterium]|nr:NnrS family protein [Rhodospirillales bacterium]